MDQVDEEIPATRDTKRTLFSRSTDKLHYEELLQGIKL